MARAPRITLGAIVLFLLGVALWLRAGVQAQPAPAPRLALRPVVTGLSAPVYLTHAGDRSGRLFVVEQEGRIRVVRDGRLLARPYLDIRSRVVSGGELGLLSVAFHPRFADHGRFFVNYTTNQGGRLRTVIAEYRAAPPDADVAGAAERILLEIDQPFRNHNGGLNLFGPDGMLYIGMGDGGSAGDPYNAGQRLDTLLGKLLRIDVDGTAPYRIPPDNPFVARNGARGEIWAYGLRNPWRFSFDRATGRLFLADVGQHQWEEIDLVVRGGNYGWKIMEGAHCYSPPEGCDRTGLQLPIAEYDHSQGCSVTGGYVYRGSRIPALVGRYLFGDYCSGRIWALTEAGGNWAMAAVLTTDLRIASFGEDPAGELYVVDHAGTVYLITARSP
ncbi:MAG: PQQ-dependent sugar dehydrogenase [Armatimonadota bacterium]|nr:PQQ-dependent sugar dehydrogenase [Armatimonadota bacterium]MDR7452446.1 PQQ-dependent sugar dehydrogenase [Armatimonadota bacterium]MDR7466184.1 PQQ-dependent sugar dehydrogenase [Armatimonadota bacterium]MDR7495133.1 PQQ-dependent sugar dehydrogenase [Armatimonadota bacterium]MDR7505797.1 PQQ-dependent sugar dehydrogenase [Armatimonadota bacterium]